MLEAKDPRIWAVWARPALALVMALGFVGPADAYRRNCHFVVEVVPNDRSLDPIIYSFRIFGETSAYRDVNDLRRRIRSRITTCVQSHWANRDAAGPPEACTSLTFYEMDQYPFTNMGAQIREDLCEANRDEIRITADIELFIRGERGCVEREEERGVVDPAGYVVIAPDYALTCPIRDAGGSEAYFPFTRLPGIRLPGRDLAQVAMTRAQGPDDCQQACIAYGEDCQAWTYRGPETSGDRYLDGVCLLKSGAGNRVGDPCCESGIRN